MPSPGGFLRDLSSSLKVWRSNIALPALSLALMLTLQVTNSVPVLGATIGLVLSLALIPWPGVERAWYFAAWRGESTTPSDIAIWVGTYFWRFFRLGLLMALFIVPFLFMEVSYRFFLLLVIIPMDVVLTFVTPALAYRTSSVRSALKIGLAMIAKAFPGCLVYVLIPPFAIQMLFLATGEGFDQALILVVTGVTTLANLAFKGAVAKFYLRSEELVLDPDEWEPA